MSVLTEMLGSALSGQNVDRLAQQVGTDRETVSKAISAAMPMIVGGLAKNTQKSESERDALNNALERDHDGGVLDNLGDLLGAAGGGSGLGSLLGSLGSMLGGGAEQKQPRALNGDGILRHALGEKRPAVEQSVARSSGLDMATVAKLLPMLAPMVMGALGKAKKERGLDAAGVAGLLDSERKTFEQNVGGSTGRGLMDLLDSNDDGSVVDELASFGDALAKSGIFDNRT